MENRLPLASVEGETTAPREEPLAGPPNRFSIRTRLYSVFAFLFLLVIGLGIFGFARLSDVNHAAEVIRDHWLRDTRILGDLNNYMSDYRAAEATMAIDDSVSMTATLDVLRAIAQGEGPEQAVLALGYAGWSAGQLEKEILANSWMICPADSFLLFDQEHEAKYERALGAIGVDLRFLADDAGHA